MKISGAQLTIKLLEELGIERVYGIPGGANLPLYDSLSKSSIQHILARHEQGAAFMAQGEARSTGLPGVCFATSGPGATNLITAIADAKMDSVPLVAITGQIPSSLIGTDAFQEVDTYGITIPITKHNFLINSVEELLQVIPKAFNIASSSRPGPVLIDIPKNIQLQQIEINNVQLEPETYIEEILPPKNEIANICEIINKAQRPVIIAGGGVASSNTSDYIQKISQKNSIPTACTLMALGTFPPDSPLYLGMPGMHGERFTNNAVQNADLIISLGSRFDDRLTGKSDKFCNNARIIHIDIDRSEFNKIKKANISIRSDLKFALPLMYKLLEQNPRSSYLEELSQIKKQYPVLVKTDTFSPYSIISEICSSADSETIVTTDVGQHQMWTAQYYKFHKPNKFLTSGGLGTMGFGLPAAIGAAMANPDRDVICFTGDGSFLMNLQELAVVKEYNLNIKIILFNNNSLGLVRQQQEHFYKENYFASIFSGNPDFTMLAQSFGIRNTCLSKHLNIKSALKDIINSKGPILINIPIEQSENVYPIVPPGKSNTEMIGGYYAEYSS